MKKDDLYKAVKNETGICRSVTEKVLKSAFSIMGEALERKEEISIMNFGSFRLRHIEGHIGVHPKTKEKVVVPSRYKIVFLPGTKIKESLKVE